MGFFDKFSEPKPPSKDDFAQMVMAGILGARRNRVAALHRRDRLHGQPGG